MHGNGTQELGDSQSCSNRIEHLSVQGFCGIRNLTIPCGVPVTLIEGANRTGKTALLNAVRLLEHGVDPSGLIAILPDYLQRIWSGDPSDKEQAGHVALMTNHFRGLFWGHPDVATTPAQFKIEGSSTMPPLVVRFGRADHIRPSRIHSPPHEQDGIHGSDGTFLAFLIEQGDQSCFFPAYHYTMRSPTFFGGLPLDHCVSVSRSGLSNTQAWRYWGNIALDVHCEELLRMGLQLVEPHLTKIAFVGSHDGSQRFQLMAQIEGERRIIADHSGFLHLVHVLLALLNAKGRIVVIDEIDNGVHSSIKRQFWEIVIAIATELNVQVFATTQHADCAAAFQHVVGADVVTPRPMQSQGGSE